MEKRTIVLLEPISTFEAIFLSGRHAQFQEYIKWHTASTVNPTLTSSTPTPPKQKTEGQESRDIVQNVKEK